MTGARSLPFVAAVWISNIPQVMPPAADLAASGWRWLKQAALWGSVVAAAGIWAVLGFGVTLASS
jgi:ZIP family zinc transporter